MKFAMESDTLSVLGQRTAGESEDLGQLVRELVAAGEPLEQSFNGDARAAFDSFKSRTDEISATLNNALVGITESIGGQAKSFATAAVEGAEEHRSSEGSAAFESADTSRFAPRG